MAFLKPAWVTEWTALIKEKGLKTLIREKGWKIIVAIFLFYLVRDSILYIIIPYFAITGFAGC